MKSTLVLGAFWLGFSGSVARADTVADWADITTEIATDAPNTIRTIALAQSAVYEAVNAITRRYPRDLVDLGPTQGASVDAAIAAANHAILLHEAIAQRTPTETAYQKMLGRIAENEASRAGIALGERAAQDVLGNRPMA